MRKSIAIAAVQPHPFKAALESAHNFGILVIDFMYGTPERTKMTYMFALGFAVVGCLLSSAAHSLQVCPV